MLLLVLMIMLLLKPLVIVAVNGVVSVSLSQVLMLQKNFVPREPVQFVSQVSSSMRAASHETRLVLITTKLVLLLLLVLVLLLVLMIMLL